MLLLVAATGVAFWMGESVEAVAILVVIVVNATIGFLIEWKAERTLSALRKQGVAMAHVLRNGAQREIVGAELVPGDVVMLAAGARVPADGRVIESAGLEIDEAALTGESRPAAKTVDVVADQSASLGDRVDMAYLGTAVTNGRARLLVTATGARTEMGQIGTLVSEAVARETPLEKKLAVLGRWLVGIVLVLCAVIVGAGWLRGNGFLEMLEVGISLAIAAVPEGLPAVATMTLAIGMQRMVRHGRHHPPPARCRDARVHHCDLYGQDGDADEKRDDRSCSHRRWPSHRRDWRRLRGHGRAPRRRPTGGPGRRSPPRVGVAHRCVVQRREDRTLRRARHGAR